MTLSEQKARDTAFLILQDVEELLDEKDITIPCSDRQGDPEEARLYGTEYYLLEDAVTDILVKGSKRTGRREQEYDIARQILDEFEEVLDRFHVRVPSADSQRATSKMALCMPEWDRLRDAIVSRLRHEAVAVGVR
jgi:hypothetical protein